MVEKEIIKRALIAGAASALNYKEKNPHASESEVMSHVTKEMRKIIEEIEEDY
ncbi:MAG: hypothetical protein NTW17_03390 [Candidatus Pacearchaeota archaeon]|nr:hypothetical protein [Candidatus Pacearchaeota archaeon]